MLYLPPCIRVLSAVSRVCVSSLLSLGLSIAISGEGNVVLNFLYKLSDVRNVLNWLREISRGGE